jgi:hypothetical protein
MVYHIYGYTRLVYQKKWLSNVVRMNLIDQFKQTWSTSVDNSPKALNYRLYKRGYLWKITWKFWRARTYSYFVISVPLITDYPLKSVGGKIEIERIEYLICVRVESYETSVIIYSNALNVFMTEPGWFPQNTDVFQIL